MRDDFGALFAASALLRDDPTASELAGGIPCGPFRQKLLNELFFALSSGLSEMNSVLDAAGIAPDETLVNQLLAAIQKLSTTNLDSRNIVGGNTVGFFTVGTTMWNPPVGVTKFRVRGCWGGGGGGLGNTGAAGAGGGLAAFGVYPCANATPIPMTVGAGGIGNNGTGSATAGGTSSVGTLCSATGGAAGGSGSTAGGTGTGGAINLSGNSGQDLDGYTTFAFGGSTALGGGGASPYAGQGPGGGGGASSASSGIGANGFNGASGGIIIEY